VICRTTHHLKSVRVTEETEILLTSRPPAQMNAAQIQAFRRGHWTIENPIHYVRDVTFGEDRSTVRTGHGPQNLATLRNLVIGFCGLDAARHHQRASYLPRFRSAASNDHQLAVNFLARPLLDGNPLPGST
jgi:predicted transposase YbfD/YdcC